MKYEAELMQAFLWLYCGLGLTKYCLMCVLNHWKHVETWMEYFISIYKLLDSIGMKYQNVKQANVGIPMAVCRSGTCVILFNVYI